MSEGLNIPNVNTTLQCLVMRWIWLNKPKISFTFLLNCPAVPVAEGGEGARWARVCAEWYLVIRRNGNRYFILPLARFIHFAAWLISSDLTIRGTIRTRNVFRNVYHPHSWLIIKSISLVCPLWHVFSSGPSMTRQIWWAWLSSICVLAKSCSTTTVNNEGVARDMKGGTCSLIIHQQRTFGLRSWLQSSSISMRIFVSSPMTVNSEAKLTQIIP